VKILEIFIIAYKNYEANNIVLSTTFGFSILLMKKLTPFLQFTELGGVYTGAIFSGVSNPLATYFSDIPFPTVSIAYSKDLK